MISTNEHNVAYKLNSEWLSVMRAKRPGVIHSNPDLYSYLLCGAAAESCMTNHKCLYEDCLFN